jgi:serine/threonine protein phosphatase 1
MLWTCRDGYESPWREQLITTGLGLLNLRPVSRFDSLRSGGKRPSLPSGLRIYAIGDIHGRLDLLKELVATIENDIAHRSVARPIYIFLGDYIDRGPSSRETIDRLIELRQANECVFLRGNHESIAIKCLSDRGLFDQWMRMGGLETLISYGIPRNMLVPGRPVVELQSAFHHAMPRSHFRFFGDLQTSFACGDFFFAHAGVKPNVDLAQQKETDLLWIRDEFLTSSRDFGKIVVHGHTPNSEIEVASNRINIDTGAFATGVLTCLVLEKETASVMQTLP